MIGRQVEFSARDGLRLAATEWPGPAERTPVLVLPGICRTARDAEAVAAHQAGRRRIVALDYAGHGESARAAAPRRYRPEALLQDVQDAMSALHLGRVALVGTSFGGLVAMALSALRPAALAAVALNDIGPLVELPGREKVVAFIGQDPHLASLDATAAWLRQHHPPLPLLDEAGWRRFAARGYAPGEDGLWHPRWDIRIGRQAVGEEAGAVPDLWPLFHGLRDIPLMLVWGQASTLLTDDTVGAMRRARPDMRVVPLPGTGHAPTLEEPAAAQALHAFLEAVP